MSIVLQSSSSFYREMTCYPNLRPCRACVATAMPSMATSAIERAGASITLAAEGMPSSAKKCRYRGVSTRTCCEVERVSE